MSVISSNHHVRHQWLRPRYFLICLVSLFIIILFGVFLTRAVEEAREAARKSPCHSNLFYLAFELRNYHERESSFPPPAFATDPQGSRLYSWRVLVSQYRDERKFYQPYSFANAWDQADNLKLANKLGFMGFACPRRQNYRNSRMTDYVAVVGSGTIFPGRNAVSISGIKDGVENTIILVEIANSKIHWSEPKYLQFDQMSFTINHPTEPSISSPHPSGPGVVFADGQYCRISESMPPDTLKALLTINGSEQISRKDLVLCQALILGLEC